MTVAVVVPYRPSGCSWRTKAWGYIREHYATNHPGWEILTGSCDGEWSKGAAVMDAVARTQADVLVVADADSYVDPQTLREAVQATHSHQWAVPHSHVHRLDYRATHRRYSTAPDGHVSYDRPPYRRVIGGGIMVITRDAYLACPIDPRFLGWGGEDVSWGWALPRVCGKPWLGQANLWHLWHPTARTSEAGTPESNQLAIRWRRATMTDNPELLAQMLADVKDALGVSV